jgi:hypothetical protein
MTWLLLRLCGQPIVPAASSAAGAIVGGGRRD